MLATVEEGKRVLVQRVHDQLHPDHRQEDCQAKPQIDQPLQQIADEEIQLSQAHQRKDVGHQDQIGLPSEPEDRRDGVERKQQVCGAERDDDDQHGGDDLLAVLDRA